MPITAGKYVAPTWRNDGPPAIDQAELQAMSDTLETLGGKGVYSGTATIPTTGWTGSGIPYEYHLAIAGILDSDRPHIGPVYTHTDAAADDLVAKAWAVAVGKGAAAVAGEIILYGTAIPEVNIPMQWEVSR